MSRPIAGTQSELAHMRACGKPRREPEPFAPDPHTP